jgi:hypothetical protein
MIMNKKLLLVEIFLGFILSYWIIRTYFSGNTIFENLALGTETMSYQALDEDNTLIHVQRIDALERSELLRHWEEKGRKDVIMFFGNSQTHSINQRKDKEVNYIELLYHNAENKPMDVLCHSFPNAGLQEFYLAYEYWKDILPLKVVVIPLFMDDMREDGVRDVFFAELVKSKYQLKDTSDHLVEKINSDLRGYWPSNPNNKTSTDNPDMAALEETFQERTETYLNNNLDRMSDSWGNRQNVRGEFFTWIYKLRNTVLGINATTVRKMIPQRYETNMRTLELLVSKCIKNNHKVVLYIPPIRSDVPLPYDQKEYAVFKEDVKNFSLQYPKSVFFGDFEKIVPGNLWGYKAATNLKAEKEIDFMHFQYKGHQILADSLQQLIRQIK